MNFPDIQRVAVWWGPGVLVLIAFGYGLLRLAQYWIEKSMEVKRQQMDGAYGLVRQYIEKFLGAQSGQADALSRLANSVEHRESQESFEHQEILIALKALHHDMNGLRCRRVEDYGAPRTTAGLGGLCASSPELSREAGFSSTRGQPEMTAKATRGEVKGPRLDPSPVSVNRRTGESVGGETPSPISEVRWSNSNRT